MVWALELPNDFGSGFPFGSLVGYGERLAKYFDTLPHEEKAKFNNRASSYEQHVYNKFKFEPDRTFPERPPLGSIKDHE